jgi:hypothetical protein
MFSYLNGDTNLLFHPVFFINYRCLFVILVAINVVAGTSTEHAQFYGGSMSFEIEKVGSSYKVQGV